MTEPTKIPNENTVSNYKNFFLLYINKSNIIDYIEIGSGGYGKVFSAMYSSTKLAIKQTRKKSNEEFLFELSIINEYRHPYMPRFLGVSLDKNMRISIILQLIEGLTLDKYMKLIYKNKKSDLENTEFSEIDKENTYFITKNQKNEEGLNQLSLEDINPNLKNHSYLSDLPKPNKPITKPSQKEIPTQIQLSLLLNFIDLSAIIYFIHGFNLIHRDLKPSNVMIEKEGFCRLLDFGISKGASNTETLVETGGTIIYMAPENFSSNANEKDTYTTRSKVSTKVDIWAFGCILSEVYSNIKPWTGVDGKIDNRTIFAKLFKKHRFPIPFSIKNNCRFIYELIEKCTEIYPERRICSMKLKYYLLCVLYYKILEMKRRNGGEFKMEKLRKMSISQYKDRKDSVSNEDKALLIKKDYLKLIKIKSNLLQLYKITNEIVINKGFFFQSIIDNSKITNEANSYTLNIDNNKIFNLTDFNRKSNGITNFTYNSCVNCVGNDPFYFERGVFNKGKKYFKESINNKNDVNNEKSNENECKIKKGRSSRKVGSKVNKYDQEDEWGD